MLLSQITEIPLYLMLLLVNLPFVVLGVYIMGWSLPLRGVVSILLLSISLQYLTIPAMTLEPILAALFGGLCRAKFVLLFVPVRH